MLRMSLLLALSLVFAVSSAQGLRLGQPGYGGNGCPAGTVSATLSPDQKTLSILFDQYVAEAGGNSGRSIDRKSCNLAIPVHVPQGLSVSLFKVDYRGFASIPPGAQGSFNVEYFFAGSKGPVLREVFNSGYERDYLITDQLVGQSTVWSRCGEEVNLRVNTSTMVRNSNPGREALVTVDSADVKAGIIYHLQWRRCN
jgi:hypothetical protein